MAVTIRRDNPIAELYYGAHHWDFRLGNYLGLLRTMSIATMVTRLYESSALRDQTYQRLKRTRELLATLVVDGLDSERGRIAMRRIRHAHSGVSAENDEYKYVLSVFFLEPARWNAQFGARPFSESERRLLLEFWMEVGRSMGITELHETWSEWRQFQQRFEERYLAVCIEGRALARTSLDEVVRLVIPPGMQELTRQALLGTMEPRVRRVLGLRSAWLPVRVSLGLMRAAAFFGAGKRVPTMTT